MMDAAVMDCLVDGCQALVPALALPDENDRHVLAAAIHCGADAIVTTQSCRSRLTNPPKSVEEYLDTLASHSLPKTVAVLLPFSGESDIMPR